MIGSAIEWTTAHWRLIARYTVVGTAAWLVGLVIQTVLVEGEVVGKIAAYGVQFLPVQILYYRLLRTFVVKGAHHRWRASFFRLLGVNALQLGTGAGLYQLFLCLFPYQPALVLASVVLTIPFFVIKVKKQGVFKTTATEAEATV
jgi:putative flippase GtrA